MEENEILDMEQEEEVVNPQSEEDSGSPGADPEGEKGSESAGRSGERQSSEDNRRYQAARHAGEQAGYERARREINDRIARTGMRNPESGEDIEDIEGLESFGKVFRRSSVRERAQREGRTEAEVEEDEANRDYLRKARKRDEEETKTKAEEARRRRWAEQDAAEFEAAYPEADLGSLMKNAKFMRFCGSRFGREPLRELYADYMDMIGDAEQAGQAKSRSKSERATGSGGNRGDEGKLTAAQQRDLEEWNRANPQMKMTAKEFLERD